MKILSTGLSLVLLFGGAATKETSSVLSPSFLEGAEQLIKPIPVMNSPTAL